MLARGSLQSNSNERRSIEKELRPVESAVESIARSPPSQQLPYRSAPDRMDRAQLRSTQTENMRLSLSRIESRLLYAVGLAQPRRAMGAADGHRRRQTVLVAAGAGVLLVAAYAPVLARLVAQWSSDENYSNATTQCHSLLFMVPLVRARNLSQSPRIACNGIYVGSIAARSDKGPRQ